jgi:hypothetical protein
MAEHAAAIGWVHLDRFRYRCKPKSWTGKKITDNGLQVAVADAAARLKGRETRRQPGGWSINQSVYFNF